jgi:hypothetical protein
VESPKSVRPDGPIPDLHQWSDLAFVMWQHRCRQNDAEVGDLNRIVIFGVTNKDSLNILKALLPNFPTGIGSKTGLGKELTPDGNSDEFDAMMGIPFGVGVGYFLAQHKDTFPGKTVVSIEILATGNHPNFIYNFG